MSEFKYFGMISKKPLGEASWEELLLAADSDYVSFMLLSFYELEMSTSLWLAHQAIEKYFKSWLKKNGEEHKKDHDLETLFDGAKKQFPESIIFKVPEFLNLICELNMRDASGKAKNHHLRYQFGVEIKIPALLKIFSSLCGALRTEILGKSEFAKRGPFGLCEASFGGGFFASKDDVKKILIPFIDSLLK